MNTFKPFKSDLSTLNIQGECTRTIFKHNKTSDAFFHRFIAWGIDSIRKIYYLCLGLDNVDGQMVYRCVTYT